MSAPRTLTTILVLALLAAQQSLAGDDYRYGDPGRDGTGKFYMDREIAQVMGHRGAGWLERPQREREERTDLLLELLALQPGDTVADIGAGTGYFALPMATLVGDSGRVLAVDIQPQMLAIIERRAREGKVTNIVPVLATETDPGLPAGEVDVVLVVDAYHEFSHPREIISSVAASLSPRGRVVLVEYRGEDRSVPIKPLHKMTVAQARREMAAAGLALEQVHDDLPRQHVMVFRRAGFSQGIVNNPMIVRYP